MFARFRGCWIADSGLHFCIIVVYSLFKVIAVWLHAQSEAEQRETRFKYTMRKAAAMLRKGLRLMRSKGGID